LFSELDLNRMAPCRGTRATGGNGGGAWLPMGSQTNDSCSDGNVVDGLIHAEHLGLQKVMNQSTAGGTIDVSALASV